MKSGMVFSRIMKYLPSVRDYLTGGEPVPVFPDGLVHHRDSLDTGRLRYLRNQLFKSAPTAQVIRQRFSAAA